MRPTDVSTGWANDAHRLQCKINSLRHHVKALQMLLKGQHAPMDFAAFEREVDAIDAALEKP